MFEDRDCYTFPKSEILSGPDVQPLPNSSAILSSPSVGACGGHGGLHALPLRYSSSPSCPVTLLLLAGRLIVGLTSPGRDGGGFGGGAVGRLLRGTARVVLAKVLVEDSLKGEAFSTNMAVEGLVSCVLADVVLQLVLPCVLFPTYAADKRRDAHVQSHVSVQASLLVEGLAAVDAGEAWVVTEPAITHLLSQVLLIAAHVKDGLLLPLNTQTSIH